jgi:hypothetical protein
VLPATALPATVLRPRAARAAPPARRHTRRCAAHPARRAARGRVARCRPARGAAAPPVVLLALVQPHRHRRAATPAPVARAVIPVTAVLPRRRRSQPRPRRSPALSSE